MRKSKQNRKASDAATQAEKELLAELNKQSTSKGRDLTEDPEFRSFFNEVLKKIPQKSSGIIMRTFDKTKLQAEKLTEASRQQFESAFDNFLEGADAETKAKSHRIIHYAAVTSAIIGLSPIPFSDAVLLVPVQLTMMARLHKLFGQSWSEGVAKGITKELVVVGLGRSVVGNILKFIPAAGTIAGGAVNATVAMTITETLGWVTVKMLNNGEDIFDDLLSFKGQFKTLLKVAQGITRK